MGTWLLLGVRPIAAFFWGRRQDALCALDEQAHRVERCEINDDVG
jgi:hypothetical protein